MYDNVIFIDLNMIIMYLLYLIIVLIFIYIFVRIYETYNELIRYKLQVENKASDISVHLSRKYNLIPALVETVKGYAKHERGVFQEVTKLRSQWKHDKKMETANMLESELSKLLLLKEEYPELKADDNFMDLQNKLNHVEKTIMNSRIVYNNEVKEYNTRIKLFPKVIIAKLFKFKEKPFFSLNSNIW